MEQVVDLDNDIFNWSEMGVPSPGNVSRQNVEAEYTNKLPSNIPIIITKSNIIQPSWSCFQSWPFKLSEGLEWLLHRRQACLEICLGKYIELSEKVAHYERPHGRVLRHAAMWAAKELS